MVELDAFDHYKDDSEETDATIEGETKHMRHLFAWCVLEKTFVDRF